MSLNEDLWGSLGKTPPADDNDLWKALAKPKVPKGYAAPKPKPTQVGAMVGVTAGVAGKPYQKIFTPDQERRFKEVESGKVKPQKTPPIEQRGSMQADVFNRFRTKMGESWNKSLPTLEGEPDTLMGLPGEEKLTNKGELTKVPLGTLAADIATLPVNLGIEIGTILDPGTTATQKGGALFNIATTVLGPAEVGAALKGTTGATKNLILKVRQKFGDKAAKAVEEQMLEWRSRPIGDIQAEFRPKTESPPPKTPEAPNPTPAKPVAPKTAKPKAEPPVAKPEPEVTGPEPSGVSRSSRAIMADLYGTNKPVTIGGKPHEQLLEEGKTKVDEGFDFEGEAASLAQSGRPASDDQWGIIAAGRDKLIEDLKRLNARLDAGDKVALGEKNALIERIADFDRNIDEVKGSAGRGLGALKIGHVVNWADLDEVKLEARRWKDTNLTTGDEKHLAEVVQGLKDTEARAAKAEAELAEERLKGATGQTRGAKAVEKIKKDRESIYKEIDDILKGAAKVHDIGSVVYESGRFVGAGGRLAWSYAREGVAVLDDIVERVIKDFADRGIKIDRQQVIDEMGSPETAPKTKTNLEKQIATLRAEAKRESTVGKKIKDDREQMKHAERMFDYEEKISDLQNQLATGKYRTPTPRENKLTNELLRLKEESDLYSAKVRSAVQNINRPRGVYEAAKDVVGLGKVITLGADFGALLRQGLHGLPHLIANPKSYGRTVKNIGAAMKSDAGLYRLEMESLGRRLPDGRLAESVRKKAGLSRSAIVGDREEGAITRLLDHLIGGTIGRIPGLKGVGGSLGRGQAGFLNTLRNEMFDSFAMRHPDATAKELQNHAAFINSALGRSATYGTKRTPSEAAQIILTSPRYEASRWEMVGNYLTSPVTAVKALKDKAARAKIINLGVTAGTVLGTLKMTAAATDSELILDPDSPDFLKLRTGDKVIDLTAGISPRLRGALRFMLYIKDPAASTKIRKSDGQPYKRNETLPSEIIKMTTRPVSPGVTGAIEERTGYSLSGWREDEGDPQGWERLMPLIMQGFKQDYERGGIGEALTNAGIEFLGGSVQRYPKPK